MSNPQHPVFSKTQSFDLWCSQLELAGERYGFAWAQLAEALKQYRDGLAGNGSQAGDESRLPEFAQEYLETVRKIAGLIERANAEFNGGPPVKPPFQERRLACRYPVQMDLEYRLLVRGEAVAAGRGRTINTSSTGILFESDATLPVQTIIQLRLDWPESRNSAARVDLHVAGRVVRSLGTITAVAIERHDFRIWRDAINHDKLFNL